VRASILEALSCIFDRFHIKRKHRPPKAAATIFVSSRHVHLCFQYSFLVFNNAVKNNVEKSHVTRVTLRQICVFALCTESGANINIA
jgi:hypothetical protein